MSITTIGSDELRLRKLELTVMNDPETIGLGDRPGVNELTLEVRVQLPRRHSTILVGAEDHEKVVRPQCLRRESPLRELFRIVGEIAVSKIDRARAGIVDLQPVGVVSVPVGDGRLVDRLDLGDDQVFDPGLEMTGQDKERKPG